MKKRELEISRDQQSPESTSESTHNSTFGTYASSMHAVHSNIKIHTIQTIPILQLASISTFLIVNLNI